MSAPNIAPTTETESDDLLDLAAALTIELYRWNAYVSDNRTRARVTKTVPNRDQKRPQP